MSNCDQSFFSQASGKILQDCRISDLHFDRKLSITLLSSMNRFKQQQRSSSEQTEMLLESNGFAEDLI